MNAKHSRLGPGHRLSTGAAILAAAQVVDTAPIEPRLSTFMTEHRSYVGAQGKVSAAEGDVRMAQAKVARRTVEVHEAMEALALALAHQGYARTKPFAAFGGVAPSSMKVLAVSDKIDAIRQLVERVQRAKRLNQKTRDSAQVAEQSARTLEAALLPLGQLAASLRMVRYQRDTIGRKWDTALAALRRETRSAADYGAPGLYPALFGRAAHTTRKRPARPVAASLASAPPGVPAAAG